jgi:hypothetical protein
MTVYAEHRRQRWPVRVLAGLVLLAAVALLWPFAAWSWWPPLIGFGVLVLLYLLRLDRLLFGWAPHLAGLVVVVLMAARSDPWAWGLAAGIVVLGVGFTRLPDVRVLVIGAVLAAGFGLGYGLVHFRTTEQRQAEQHATDQRTSQAMSAVQPGYVVPFLASYLAAGDSATVCPMLQPPADAQFAAAFAAGDCAAAVRAFAAQVPDKSAYRSAKLAPTAITKNGDSATVDGCQARWPGPMAGPALGVFELTRYQQTDRFLITGYRACTR